MCDKRNSVITYRTTEQEKQALENLADRFGVSVGFIIRKATAPLLARPRKQCMTLHAERKAS